MGTFDENNGGVYDDHGTYQAKSGMKFTVGGANITVISATKFDNVNCTPATAYLTDSSLVTIASANFSGTVATFSSPVTLTANTSYYILADSSGGNYEYGGDLTGSPAFPIAGTYLTWIKSYISGADQNTYVLNFPIITLSVGPTYSTAKVNIGDTWKSAAKVSINIGDTWKDADAMKINIGDTWKAVF